MSFWKKLFGGGATPAPPAAVAPAKGATAAPAMDLSRAGTLLDCGGIDWNGDAQLAFVNDGLARHVGHRLAPLLTAEPFRGNTQCTPVDAAVLFAILAEYEPTRLMEVGSGYTTLVFNHGRRVLNLPGELISVDPAPQFEIGEFVDAQLIMPVEDMPVDDFKLLMERELAFFDLTHRDGPGSGIEHVYTKLLPALNSGVVVGFHGVRLPREYTAAELQQGWNEQARLLQWLKAERPEILFSGGWLAEHHPGAVAKALPGVSNAGESTALWVQIR